MHIDAPVPNARHALRELARDEVATLARLSTPEKIQTYLNALPANHELEGETVSSVRTVLRDGRAHCIEGAFVAACALWLHGRPPLLMHLDCSLSDYPHVVALFRRGQRWGALSKSNGAWLRYRDPVYRTLRELAMSYFHEYFDSRGRKTLRSYSAAFDLSSLDPALWVTSEAPCWNVHERLAHLRHYPLLLPGAVRSLAPRDAFERRAAKLVQYPRPRRAGRD